MTYADKLARAAVLVCGVFAACADDDDVVSTDTRPATAQVDIATAQAALTTLSGNVDVTVTSFAPTASGAAVSVACAAGGQANVTGHVNVVPVPVNVDVAVEISYAGCQTMDGAILGGSLQFQQRVAAGSQPLRVETFYMGDVQFSGRVQARCSTDVHVLVDETGRTVSIDGMFCGHDATEFNLQVAPRWGT